MFFLYSMPDFSIQRPPDTVTIFPSLE
jgi:hypothetical protein